MAGLCPGYGRGSKCAAAVRGKAAALRIDMFFHSKRIPALLRLAK
jgi:hypothetical protein